MYWGTARFLIFSSPRRRGFPKSSTLQYALSAACLFIGMGANPQDNTRAAVVQHGDWAPAGGLPAYYTLRTIRTPRLKVWAAWQRVSCREAKASMRSRQRLCLPPNHDTSQLPFHNLGARSQGELAVGHETVGGQLCGHEEICNRIRKLETDGRQYY